MTGMQVSLGLLAGLLLGAISVVGLSGIAATPRAMGLAQPQQAADAPDRAGQDASFWLAPKSDLDLSRLGPVAVQLLAAPDNPRGFALIKTSELDPSDNF